jgi:hypothetical protein
MMKKMKAIAMGALLSLSLLLTAGCECQATIIAT